MSEKLKENVAVLKGLSPAAKFTPSPIILVRVVNKEGKLVKIVPMNRAKRRKLGIKKRSVNNAIHNRKPA